MPAVGDMVYLPKNSPLGVISDAIISCPGRIVSIDNTGWAMVDRGRWGQFGCGVDDLRPVDLRPAEDNPWAPGWPHEHMLEAAMGLLANAVAFDPATGWETAKQRWMDAYHAHLTAAGEREAPMPPKEWLDKFSASSKGSGGYGWQTGWLAGYAAAQADR